MTTKSLLKFHDPWGKGSCARARPYKLYEIIMKMHYFFKNIFLYSYAEFR